MSPQQIISARKDSKLAVLEGFHALKHAIRFNAEIIEAVTSNKEALLALAGELAPDVSGQIAEIVREIDEAEFTASAPIPIRSGVISVAMRKSYDTKVIEESKNTVVWLDHPKNHENVGAVIRLVAGLGAGAVVISGDMDIWHPAVLRGSAGLHYAVPAVKSDSQPADYAKPTYVFDENGKDMGNVELKKDSMIVFGGERHGVSEQIKAEADEVIAIKMRPGVSSLNLATSVAVALAELG